MVKKKQTEEVAPMIDSGNKQEEEIQKENTQITEVEADGDTTEVEKPTQKNESADVVVKPQDKIPDTALDYLKRHAEVKKVYIDKLGGVFSANTPKIFLKDATLYQNPFYKQ